MKLEFSFCVYADHPGPCAGAELQEQPDVEQSPWGTVCSAAVLRIPGRLPLLLRYARSVTHTRPNTKADVKTMTWQKSPFLWGTSLYRPALSQSLSKKTVSRALRPSAAEPLVLVWMIEIQPSPWSAALLRWLCIAARRVDQWAHDGCLY